MTPSAHDFITPLTLSTLSKNPVLTNFQKDSTGTWNNHVELGLWADALIIAPASANTIAKMSTGICDNLLMAVYLSARCKVYFAPAMDIDMLQHPSTKANIEKLISWGNQLIEPAHGELASGLVGKGRMAEPDEIIDFLKKKIESTSALSGKKALVTAGPTHEAIDPVRFISNSSTGKMGYAVAEELAKNGAEVTLISGPTSLTINNTKVKIVKVTSAEEMYQSAISNFPHSDVSVLSAAVADYKPAKVASQKIKKADTEFTLELVKTKDIAAELGKLKKTGQMIVGFALETENELTNAKKKLESKNFDLIVLNSLNDKDAGFGFDTNKITIINKKEAKEFNLKSKKEVAEDIVNEIIKHMNG
jgi:phosphopantothenoylcysteine decarboxylase/phosphopantothenate--cysteine ligase